MENKINNYSNDNCREKKVNTSNNNDIEYPIVLGESIIINKIYINLIRIDSQKNQGIDPWKPRTEPPVCSLIQAKWTDDISSLSTNPKCFCPVGNKASNTINNKKVYKCQIPYPTSS
jgi:hypothetical protein